MGRVGVILLTAFVCLAGGLAACGTSCNDACEKMQLCTLWQGPIATCTNLCENSTDCMTECNTNLDCINYYLCLYHNCGGIIW